MNAPGSTPVQYRILIIDDTPTIHEDFRKILTPTEATVSSQVHDYASAIFGATGAATAKPSQFVIDSAMQGDEGLERVVDAQREGFPYALAFVDMRMPPGWGGIETIRRIWAVDPSIQIVICTAFSDVSWEETVRSLGETDHLLILKKPFDGVEALQLAHALTKKWTIARQNSERVARLDHVIRRRTDELHAAENKFLHAFNASPLPQIIQDLNTGQVLEGNDAHLKFTGRSREQLVLTDEWFGIGPAPEEWPALLGKVKSGEPVDEFPILCEDAKGGLREIRCSGRAMTIDQHACAVWIFRDVTDQRQLENQLRQSQKMEAVGQLAAGVAHDFNNLLTVILSYASFVLEDQTLAEEHRIGLSQVSAAAQRAAALTRQLLVFSRRQIAKPEPLDLRATLGSLREMLARLLPERIRLDFCFDEQLPSVLADPANIEQVVMNLVVNARDAIPTAGTIRMELREINVGEAEARRHANARCGRFVRLSVTDDGKGMDEATQSRIFEPFFTTKVAGQGTGLGLSTVYAIVRQHEGWIEVQSAPNRGASFSIFLPIWSGEETPDLPSENAVEFGPTMQGCGERVLLVEDEPFLRETVSLLATRAGYDVTIAPDARAAREAWSAASKPFDLLFTDIVMPNGVTGLELANELREQNPHLKVILTTGYSEDLLKDGAPAVNGHSLLLKPYGSTALLELMRRTLDAAETTHAV
jgi:signal transduction histidine kinase/DNA-binding NarL/FixJ family response regulator